MAKGRGGTATRKRAVYNAKVEQVLKEYAAGRLKDSHGRRVTSRKQAVAIALAEGRRAAGT